jgi:D-alanine transfer protein
LKRRQGTANLVSLVKAGTPNQRRHLSAVAIALAIAAVGVAAGIYYCDRIERLYVHALAPDFSDVKLQGEVLQKKAFAQPDLLVLYGSSELVQDLPANPNQFFQDYPTGFRVFPVGKPGTTSLAILQKIAAVGPDIRGRKVAFSISPGFYFYEQFDPKYYEGNFSELLANELAFSTTLSLGLKRDVARRMLDFPDTLEGHWLLTTALDRLAGDTLADRATYYALWPLGLLSTAFGRGQDHFATTLHILDEDERLNPLTKRGLRALNWPFVLKNSAQGNAKLVQAKRNYALRVRPKVSHDKAFIATVSRAKEWTDVELLMRTLKELRANPLFLSMPIEDVRLEAAGLTPDARNAFVGRLDGLARRYKIPLLAFREHEKDPGFLADFFDHLSPQGWLYFDKALDDFYHAPED